MYAVYFMFFQVASATATRYGLSRGLLGLKYDQIKYSDSDSDSMLDYGVHAKSHISSADWSDILLPLA